MTNQNKTTPLLENTFYINLEERKDRLEHVMVEMGKMGIKGERISACKVKGGGAIGCTMSHIKCIELAKERRYSHVFIMEDDITFFNPELLKTNITRFQETCPMWDVLIIGGNVVPPYQKIADEYIRVSNVQTTTGYIVRNHYYDTLLMVFRESVKNLIRNPANIREYALDIYWKKLQKTGNWYMIIPPTVSQYESYSDIENRVVNYHHLMLDTDKKWLFTS
jgi:GR25 family glycosyltransferase involved in LPS biosynthesis